MVAHYLIVCALGRGGMGTVFLAEDTRLARRVALKVLDAALAAEQRDWVLREARAAAAVVHPHVASVFSVEEHDGQAFIVMEYMTGKTLRKLIPRDGMPRKQAIGYGIQIARGLAHAHQLGVVHYDLKPDNVLVTEEGVARILDFGLAQGPATDNNSLIPHAGTPQYMAPERKEGRGDVRSDVFALGVTLHEMLTGERGEAGARPNLRPRRLAALLSRCLASSPEDRPENALAVLQELEKCGSQRRNVLVGVGLLVGCAVAAGWWSRGLTHAQTGLLAEQVTSNSVEAPVSQAALSPDGTRLAYVDVRGLLVMRLSDRQENLLLGKDRVGQFSRVAWFRNGNQLAFITRKELHRQVLVVDAASGQSSILSSATSMLCAVPSPDGTRIAYARVTPDGEELGTFELARPEELRRLHVVSDEEHLFSSLAWSFDSKWIAFGTYSGRFDVKEATLWIASPDDLRTRLLLSDVAIHQQSYTAAFTWTSNRRLVVAMAPRSPFQDSQQLQALTLPDDPFDPSLSLGAGQMLGQLPGNVLGSLTSDASGKRLAFVRYAKQADVWVGSLTSSDPAGGKPGRENDKLTDVRRLTLSEKSEWPSDWTSDGKSVLVVSEGKDGYAAARLSSTAVASPLTSGAGWTTWPTQGPGGVLYWAVADSTASLFHLRSDGRASPVGDNRLRAMTEGTGRPPPRNAWVRCASEKPICVVGRLESGGVVLDEVTDEGQLHRLGGPIDVPWTRGIALSPDGLRVAIADQARRRIVVSSLDGKSVQTLATPGRIAQFAAWLPDNASLLVTTMGGPDGSSIERWSGEERVVLWSCNWGWVTHPVVSREGRVAFAVTPFHGNAWIADGL
jgi:Protein kinase domain